MIDIYGDLAFFWVLLCILGAFCAICGIIGIFQAIFWYIRDERERKAAERRKWNRINSYYQNK